MKKGANHLDWAISMGIFLLAVLSIFAFLKPFSINLYTGEELADIMQENFEDATFWTVKRLPLFVNSCTKPFTVTASFGNGWKTMNDTSSYITSETRNHIIYLHNLDRKKELASSLSISPAECGNIAKFGVPENKIGISKELLTLLKNSDYEALRGSWKIPPGRDFAIFIDEAKLIGKDPDQRANVFAEQSKEFIVSKKGDLTEVTISYRVW